MLCTPVVYWLERCPFKAEKRDRNPFGVPFLKPIMTAPRGLQRFISAMTVDDSRFNKCLGSWRNWERSSFASFSSGFDSP